MASENAPAAPATTVEPSKAEGTDQTVEPSAGETPEGSSPKPAPVEPKQGEKGGTEKKPEDRVKELESMLRDARNEAKAARTKATQTKNALHMEKGEFDEVVAQKDQELVEVSTERDALKQTLETTQETLKAKAGELDKLRALMIEHFEEADRPLAQTLGIDAMMSLHERLYGRPIIAKPTTSPNPQNPVARGSTNIDDLSPMEKISFGLRSPSK